MPTSSIKADIRIKDKAAAEAFVAALEESENRDVQTDVCVSEKSATEEIETSLETSKRKKGWYVYGP